MDANEHIYYYFYLCVSVFMGCASPLHCNDIKCIFFLDIM
jgi:hypothetical protein